MSYVLILASIGLLILLHEAGHLAAGKAAGLTIERFSIGFGPRLWSVRTRETEYQISFIPCGGYVLPKVTSDDEWLQIPLLRRLVFSMGGPVANVVVAFLCLVAASIADVGPSVAAVILLPLEHMGHLVGLVWSMIPQIFANPDQLSGVVGVTAAGGREIGLDLLGLLRFASLLSVNLAMLNLLPLPPLDGGTILMSVLQRVHRPLGRLRLPLALAGWCGLGLILLYTTVLDVWRLLGLGTSASSG